MTYIISDEEIPGSVIVVCDDQQNNKQILLEYEGNLCFSFSDWFNVRWLNE